MISRSLKLEYSTSGKRTFNPLSVFGVRISVGKYEVSTWVTLNEFQSLYCSSGTTCSVYFILRIGLVGNGCGTSLIDQIEW